MFNRCIENIGSNRLQSPYLRIYILICFLAVVEQCMSAEKTRQDLSDDLKTCDSGTCIPLQFCQPFLKLLRSRSSKHRREISKKSCGLQNERLLVCCPDSREEEYFPLQCGNSKTVNRIHGGTLADLGEFPWMVALGYQAFSGSNEKFSCGGSLINARYVLTAAHCLHKNDTRLNKLTVVRLGEYNLSSPIDCVQKLRSRDCFPEPIDAKPEKIIIHPHYNVSVQYAADIALIRLDRTINLADPEGKIEAVCLPDYGFNLKYAARDTDAIAIGWGSTEEGEYSDTLLKVNLPIVEDKTCKRKYRRLFSEHQICVGGQQGKDACQGDSGGPLLLPSRQGTPYLQVGVVSFGVGCGNEEYPGVYTSVSDYIDWIKSSIEPW